MNKIYEQDLPEDISALDYTLWYHNSWLENGVRVGYLVPEGFGGTPNKPMKVVPTGSFVPDNGAWEDNGHGLVIPGKRAPMPTMKECIAMSFDDSHINKYRGFVQKLSRRAIDVHRTGHAPELVIMHPKTAMEIIETLYMYSIVTSYKEGVLVVRGLKVYRSEDVEEWDVIVK